MRIDISQKEFEGLWESTGEMIKENEITFIQTYSNRNDVQGKKFRVIGKNNFIGGRIILEEVKN